MTASIQRQLNPRSIRLEAATACQLKCPSCPTASGETGKGLGVGFLTFDNFKKFVDTNTEVSLIEISNWGEIFLNKDIIRIFKYAYEHDVALTVGNGSNLNTVRPEALEAIVKYKLRFMTVSIDGASQETYVTYRVNGNFNTVISNIKEINRWKKHYKTNFPQLRWQYVAFAHNEHEINKARKMAKELDMYFYLKLSWGDLYNREFAPVRNKELIRRESGLDAADREEYRRKYGHQYVAKEICLELWKQPQINFDGRMLGCSINHWSDYGNVFEDGLLETVNNEKMEYAREMVMGRKSAKEGIPCSTCKIYENMKRYDQWIEPQDTKVPHTRSRNYLMVERLLGAKLAGVALRSLSKSRRAAFYAKKFLKPKNWKSLLKGRFKNPDQMIKSEGYAIPIVTKANTDIPWKPNHFFKGCNASTEFMQAHASSLIRGHIPHPPHSHLEEEILIVLSGEADLILPELGTDIDNHCIHVKAGDFVYYPSYFCHTLQSTSPTPANYLMFKWFANSSARNEPLKFRHFNAISEFAKLKADRGFSYKVLFEGSTDFLSKLQCHISVMPPGAGYAEHADNYDVAIIVLEGEVQTIDGSYCPNSLIYYAAGDLHGMKNTGSVSAKYIVFEFHPA